MWSKLLSWKTFPAVPTHCPPLHMSMQTLVVTCCPGCGAYCGGCCGRKTPYRRVTLRLLFPDGETGAVVPEVTNPRLSAPLLDRLRTVAEKASTPATMSQPQQAVAMAKALREVVETNKVRQPPRAGIG